MHDFHSPDIAIPPELLDEERLEAPIGRLPSSLPISRSSTRAAIVPSRPLTGREWSFDDGDQDPLSEPANVAGQTTSPKPLPPAATRRHGKEGFSGSSP